MGIDTRPPLEHVHHRDVSNKLFRVDALFEFRTVCLMVVLSP